MYYLQPNKMPNLTAYWQRFKIAPNYLWEDQEQEYIHSVPGGGYFAYECFSLKINN
jgi:hypothetical protein